MIARKQVLGNYTLGKTIGQGAFSKVKLGIHKDTGQKVAIKIIDKQQMAAKAAKAKKAAEEREARKKLDHPNVINLYQVIETENECYVIMEYAAGGELVEYIAAKDYLTEKEARRFFRQIISAMDHCHLANVVHRDLKLENLLLNEHKDILISDFGLGRTYDPNSDEYLKTFCGTPNYAAVELISGTPYNGVKSDVWAMGVVLYIMMTGKPPFTGENISALYSKIKAVDYKCPDYFSKELRALLAKMLKKDPKLRTDMAGLRNDPWVNLDET
ncbi:kinase-like domain-containing protein, partial [Zopfochytrium polystomum]